MLTYTDEEMFRLLEDQRHRRFIKTHTPLDGVPRLPSVTYMTVIRHPLDAALSYRDHEENLNSERLVELRATAAGPDDSEEGWFGEAAQGRESERHPEDEPEAPDAYLRWFIDNDREPNGSGPYGLADYCNQIRTYWDARGRPNVHLFHYTDLWNERESEMRKVAAALGVTVAEERRPAFVEAAGLYSMRSRAADTIPENQAGIWRSPERFFRVGGTRDWASLLDSRDITHFKERLRDLAGEASDWVLRGRVPLEDSSHTG
jgi:aryl sulfotransferase